MRYSCLPAFIMVVALVLVACGLMSCNKARAHYQNGMAKLHASQFGEALENFEAALVEDPASNMALFGKARSLYELKRFDEALPCFEQFITQTESVRATYSDERFDAEFYRDKCKLELGIEVPQDPDAIPEERMRY